MDTEITIEHLSKRFGEMVVYKDFSTAFASGKITVLFGPNGAGKTTLLNILAGIERADGGMVTINSETPSALPRQDFSPRHLVTRFGVTPSVSRKITSSTLGVRTNEATSYVFQNYRESLLPWRNAFANLAFPLELQRMSREKIKRQIGELLAEFPVDFDLEKYPYELSGGQQQLLSFLRAIITKPTLLLLDEPFSALDYENNLRLREYLLRYNERTRGTVLLVTHDIEEAVHLGHEIAIISRKPTQIVERIENPLLRQLADPRTLATLSSEAFHQTRNRVLGAFQRALR